MNYKAIGFLAALALLGACSDNTTGGASTGGASGGGGASASSNGGANPGSQQDLVANVGDRVFFAYDQTQLSSDARATLDRQVQWLQRYPQVSIQMAGNTDERGTEEYNLALGQRRANAARDYLVAQGVSSARINTISYGKERPAATGADEQAYSQDRNAITSVQ